MDAAADRGRRRHVDREEHVVGQPVQCPERRLDRREIELDGQADLGRFREPRGRRPSRIAVESCQRLDADDVPACQVDDRLVHHSERAVSGWRLPHAAAPEIALDGDSPVPLRMRVELGLQLDVVALNRPVERPHGEEVPDPLDELDVIVGFGEKVVDPGIERPLTVPGRRVARQHEHREKTLVRQEPAQ